MSTSKLNAKDAFDEYFSSHATLFMNEFGNKGVLEILKETRADPRWVLEEAENDPRMITFKHSTVPAKLDPTGNDNTESKTTDGLADLTRMSHSNVSEGSSSEAPASPRRRWGSFTALAQGVVGMGKRLLTGKKQGSSKEVSHEHQIGTMPEVPAPQEAQNIQDRQTSSVDEAAEARSTFKDSPKTEQESSDMGESPDATRIFWTQGSFANQFAHYLGSKVGNIYITEDPTQGKILRSCRLNGRGRASYIEEVLVSFEDENGRKLDKPTDWKSRLFSSVKEESSTSNQQST